MSTKIKARLQELLSQEQGAVVREWGARFPVALVYPQVYAVGMGNLGFQTMYHLLNAHPGFVCERAFLPSPEEAEEHRRTRTPILSLESQRPLKDFAAVAFSISFEADYPYVLDLLAGAGIPLRAAERGPGEVAPGDGGDADRPDPLLRDHEGRRLRDLAASDSRVEFLGSHPSPFCEYLFTLETSKQLSST